MQLFCLLQEAAHLAGTFERATHMIQLLFGSSGLRPHVDRWRKKTSKQLDLEALACTLDSGCAADKFVFYIMVTGVARNARGWACNVAHDFARVGRKRCRLL